MKELADHKIRFHYLSEPFHFRNRTSLKEFIQNLIKREGFSINHINYIFCTDDYLIELNKTHLNHDTYTDIITFQISTPAEPILADIYISIERVAENANSFQSPFTSELHRVIFHGALHLCGYKDKSSKDARLMRSKEEECISRYFVPRGTKPDL